MTGIRNICLLGFGEVGTTLARNLLNCPSGGDITMRAYDRVFAEANSAPSRAAREMTAMTACESAEEAAEDCQLIISAVTANQCIAAAKSVVPAIAEGAWYLDLNSVSPGTKRQAAQLIEGENGRFVECAVMGPIQPLEIASPMIFGGRHAASFLDDAFKLGFSGASVFAEELGQASAAKMCRSVVIKGMESLVTESMLAARRYGVESVVIDSLQNLMPGVDWAQHARYLISRSLIHGARRAEEMQQVAATLVEAGIEPLMSEACATRQAMAPSHVDAAEESELTAMLDRMLCRATRSQGISNANN